MTTIFISLIIALLFMFVIKLSKQDKNVSILGEPKKEINPLKVLLFVIVFIITFASIKFANASGQYSLDGSVYNKSTIDYSISCKGEFCTVANYAGAGSNGNSIRQVRFECIKAKSSDILCNSIYLYTDSETNIINRNVEVLTMYMSGILNKSDITIKQQYDILNGLKGRIEIAIGKISSSTIIKNRMLKTILTNWKSQIESKFFTYSNFPSINACYGYLDVINAPKEKASNVVKDFVTKRFETGCKGKNGF